MKIIFFDADNDKNTESFFTNNFVIPAKAGTGLVKGEQSELTGAELEFVTDATPAIGSDLSAEALAEVDADVISVTVNSKITAAVLAKFPNLKLIATRSTGYNHIDLDYCKAHGVKVANVTGYGEIAVAEFAVGLMLALTRKIFLAAGDLRAGRVDMQRYAGHDISGKVIGVFGTGATGSHFAKLVHAFGAIVIAHDRTPNPALDGIVEYTDLDDLYARSDIVALNIPSNAENYHIINDVAISKMKPGAKILNVARGELINAGALYDALLSGQIGGAAMDVMEYEGQTAAISGVQGLTDEQARTVAYNSKMLKMDNVIITPHAAFNSAEANQKILNDTLATITAFATGQDFKTIQ